MSETYFVGTDVLLCFLTRDDPERAERCRDLLTQAVNGLVTLEVTVLSIVRVVEALEGQYPKQAIATKLPGLLQIPGILVHEREILLRALELYAQHDLAFSDACQLAHVQSGGSKAIYSFAEVFDRGESIQRLEP